MNTIPTRTDDQILMSEPVMVTLGGKKYPIKPLTIRRSREWRKSLSDNGSGIIDRLGKSAKSTDDAASIILLEIPDQIADALFAYAPNLPRETIMEEATDRELLMAFREVLKLAYPFVEEFQTLRALVPGSR